jgi:hypothetical protein
MTISGIYVIEFLNKDYFYIGSTRDFDSRVKSHINKLKNSTHPNPILQNFYNKYPDEIYFRLIKKVCIQNLRDREQDYLDTFDPYLNCSKEKGYTVQALKLKK